MTDDLRPHLTQAAKSFDIPPGDVDAVVGRARHRAARSRRSMALLGVAALAGTATVVVQRAGGDGDSVPVVAGGGVRTGDAGIEWRRVDVRTALGQATTTSGTPLYALSTAAGERDSARTRRNGVVWRSDDSVNWSSVSALGDDLYLSDLSQRGSRIYAIGTGPATAAVSGGRPVPNLLLGWSDDGARSWQRRELPVDMARIAAASTAVNVMPTIAGGPKGTVAVVTVRSELNVPKLLPAGAIAPNGWAISATGVDVLGPRPKAPCPPGTSEAPPGEKAPEARSERPQRVWAVWCFDAAGKQSMIPPQKAYGVVASYSFDQLGVTGDLLHAVTGRPIVFAAAPGTTDFKRGTPPEIGADASVQVEAHDEGFDLVASTFDSADRGSIVLLRSEDGKAWSPRTAVGGRPGWVAAAGRLGGTTTLLASSDDGGSLLRDNGSGGWTSTSLADVVGPAVAQGRKVHVAAAGIGRFGAAAVVFAQPEKIERGQDGDKGERPAFRLLVTRDGTTWEDQPLDELIDAQAGQVLRVLVSDTQVTVAVALDGPGRGPVRQVALVGRAR